jgi:hypothetical protein
MGGPTTQPHHRRSVQWLGANVPGGVLYEIEGAQHGAHLSHPDHFAAMTRLVVQRAGGSNTLVEADEPPIRQVGANEGTDAETTLPKGK